MTTFQDPPPQSRRSARLNERGGMADEAQQLPIQQQQQYSPQPYPQQSFQQPQPEGQSSGRRARPASPQNLYEVPPEPLNYTTQGAPYAAQQTSPNYAAQPAAPAPAQESAPYRVRDFSPEAGKTSGRRASAPPLVEPPVGGYNATAGDINYQTQGYPAAGTSPAAAPSAPASRREQRLRQAEQEAGQAPGQATGEQLPYNPGLLAQSQPPMATAASAVTAPSNPLPTTPPMTGQLFADQRAPQQQPAAPFGVQAPTPMPTSPPPLQQPAPTALSNAMAEFEALTRTGQQPPLTQPAAAPQPVVQQVAPPQSYLAPEIEQTGGWVPPVGHWSRQADLDDETQPYASTITREVGGGNVATTTSALVLPEIPRADHFSSALTSTGEVVLTGSIDLPRSLGSMGADSRLYDDPGVDRMFDSQDAEFTGTDSAPVRAIRAVSTHSGSRGVIQATKPKGNRLITVVFIATAVLAVAVVGMLVASLSLGLF